MSESHLVDWDTLAGVPTRDQRYVSLGDWEIDQAVSDLQERMGLGDIPIGTTLSSFITEQKGHAKVNLDGSVELDHGEDKVTVTAKDSPLVITVKKMERNRSKQDLTVWGAGVVNYGNWSAFKTSVFTVNIQPGETHQFTNGENGDTSDLNITLTLADILPSAAEVEAKKKQDALDKTLKDPNATAEAKALAQTQYSSMQQEAAAQGAAATAAAQAQQGAATSAAFQSIAVPVVAVAAVGLGLILAWQYLHKEE